MSTGAVEEKEDKEDKEDNDNDKDSGTDKEDKESAGKSEIQIEDPVFVTLDYFRLVQTAALVLKYN